MMNLQPAQLANLGGIGKEVDDRMDVYRNNPQKLQQKAKVSKDLLDLMALQKLEKEKQAAARSLAMSMEQNPDTIKAQMERKALAEQQRNMGDVVRNVGGALNTKRRKEQKNLKRLAELGLGGARRPPAQGGIMNAANPLRVQGMGTGLTSMASAPVKRAQGGIVSFAQGEKVKLTNAQIEQLRKIFPFNAPEEIRRIEQLEVGSPAAINALAFIETRQKELEEKSGETPFGRGLSDFTKSLSGIVGSPYEGGSPESKLEKIIQDKYGQAAAIAGTLMEQTDESRQYAKDVISKLRTGELSYENLRDLAVTPYDPRNFNLSAMPDIYGITPSSEETSTITAKETVGEKDQFVPNLTFTPKTFESELANFTDEDLTPEVAVPIMPSTDAVEKAQDRLLGSIYKKAPVPKIETGEFVDFQPGDASKLLSSTGRKIQDRLLERASTDFAEDVEAGVLSARDDAADFYGRDSKAEAYKKQLAAEQAFQDRQLDPKTVRFNKTLETLLGGGQYGRGGIGRAYLEAEKRYRDLESGGLKTLRDIEDTGISTDYNIATQAVTAGDNFGTRAQQRVSDAAKIFGDVIGTEQTMSLQEQKARQDIEDAETLAENEQERLIYQAESDRLRKQTDARRTILDTETNKLLAQTDVVIAKSKNQQDAFNDAVKRKIKQAEKLDEFKIEVAKLAQLNSESLYDLYYEQLRLLREEKKKIEDEDIILRNLELSMSRAAIENTAEYDRIKERYDERRDVIESLLADRFSFAYAKLALIRQMAEMQQSQLPGRINPNAGDDTVTVTEE